MPELAAARRANGKTAGLPLPIIDNSSTTNSIAVLPFADFPPDGNQGYFVNGISEELLNALMRIESLDVISDKSYSD